MLARRCASSLFFVSTMVFAGQSSAAYSVWASQPRMYEGSRSRSPRRRMCWLTSSGRAEAEHHELRHVIRVEPVVTGEAVVRPARHEREHLRVEAEARGDVELAARFLVRVGRELRWRDVRANLLAQAFALALREPRQDVGVPAVEEVAAGVVPARRGLLREDELRDRHRSEERAQHDADLGRGVPAPLLERLGGVAERERPELLFAKRIRSALRRDLPVHRVHALEPEARLLLRHRRRQLRAREIPLPPVRDGLHLRCEPLEARLPVERSRRRRLGWTRLSPRGPGPVYVVEGDGACRRLVHRPLAHLNPPPLSLADPPGVSPVMEFRSGGMGCLPIICLTQSHVLPTSSSPRPYSPWSAGMLSDPIL